jgi:hypothetical protein
MKAKFQFGLAAMTGRSGDIVYCMDKVSNRVYVRRYVYPRISEHNHNMGNISKNVFALQPSEGYKEDMKDYLFRYRALRFGSNKQITCWSVLYIKMMRDMAKAVPDIDLLTITREEIYARDLPCISVKRAVDAGLLPKVYGYENYTHEM